MGHGPSAPPRPRLWCCSGSLLMNVSVERSSTVLDSSTMFTAFLQSQHEVFDDTWVFKILVVGRRTPSHVGLRSTVFCLLTPPPLLYWLVVAFVIVYPCPKKVSTDSSLIRYVRPPSISIYVSFYLSDCREGFSFMLILRVMKTEVLSLLTTLSEWWEYCFAMLGLGIIGGGAR